MGKGFRVLLRLCDFFAKDCLRKEIVLYIYITQSTIVEERIGDDFAIVSKDNNSETPDRAICLDDFCFLAVIGKGNFGKVMLVREKLTNNHYAIKILRKSFIIEHDEVESSKSEKRCFQIATTARHPFLVNLHSTFQTESRLYFVMEFVSGGDLMWHIQRNKFTAEQAKFYTCEVLVALEYWHKNNIAYRYVFLT